MDRTSAVTPNMLRSKHVSLCPRLAGGQQTAANYDTHTHCNRIAAATQASKMENEATQSAPSLYSRERLGSVPRRQ
eukprot:scaffold5895_cov169-Skeletonema_dohrnii-CCMP3373.AAC.2